MTASILVFADNPTILENLGLTLLGAGYDVITAEDSQAAQAALEAQAIDLVVSDLAVPRPEGLAFFERTRRDSRWAKLPFLFITGLDLPNKLAADNQPAACLYRPVQPEDLLATVEHLLTVVGNTCRSEPPPEWRMVRQSCVGPNNRRRPGDFLWDGRLPPFGNR